MLEKIIDFSVKNKLIVILFTLTIAAFGFYSVLKIPVGAVPDITNNQIQVITTSSNLSTQEIEQFITMPIEMELSNLPGVKEIRSISKFGISVVTVVFEENLGTYLPRQLIAEKIKTASANIPENYGSPEMGPITTGLGEIYQYIVDVKPEYKDKYTTMDLRTIQDWIIKRRLSGINGVVEINSWGGYLKQYEVSVIPSKLKSLDISLMEVFNALENNNEITGASYIEKTNQSYFIRGDGQAKSLEDIENIVVKNNAGTPILIKDIANVKFGYANRFGAITANGKGETVLGQIMMLKDANSKEVINEVKKRIAEIQNDLPEGVFINPILDRSELISKTSLTVTENLIFGTIIVLLVVVMFLGNLRSAMVIASMIPLTLLFTIGMMFIFGIDANLMSLGALDFGIIIDGAVIIVEYIAIKLVVQKDKIFSSQGDERQTLLDKISISGSSQMMKSAIFGQIIILIVFIPILSLKGVEGKMFRPMALSFSFAIIGAMILGNTWLPVASALFLKPPKTKKPNISDWIVNKIYLSYYPVIKWSCGHKRIVLGTAIISLFATGILFTQIGGEFVPTLDEGDFVIQPVLKTGTSLSKTIEMTTKMENILISKFPNEVDQIVSRIGAAEVPTDPMSMEEIDMIIKLKPKKMWTSATNKEELAEKFKAELSIIPGVDYEFTQPIEMRFNELITGVRSDIAIKIFGENLEYLNQKALEIKNLIAKVPGVSDIIVEKTAGLPQIKVNYNRNRLAYYGLDIHTLNSYLSAAFGGVKAGVIFEDEKRFDLVMRFDNQSRTDIDDINQLQVPLSNGQKVTLSELADIQYTQGPAKISHENAHRMVVISVNVRNRDLKSVILDIQQLIQKNIKLQPGNFIKYGGQFENLENATNRLMIAVPVALLLIFIFLHFAFKSLKDAIMIYTAIPLASVGGVFLLWIRGMPFSVSAGIGFIALFGIAVLNGIVLIEHLKELQHNGMHNIRELIITGTKNRFRPVLLTASAAAMGFLPMAISTGAGAEVQRPLATVVIGGLITSTMLTMIVLPLLFEIFYNVKSIKFFPLRIIRSSPIIMLILIFIPTISIFGQHSEMKLNAVIDTALNNNYQVKAYNLKIEESKILKKSAFAPDKTIFSYGTDQNNIAENGYPLKVWGIEQNFRFPTLYYAEKKSKQLEVSLAETNLNIVKNELIKNVSITYFELQILLNKHKLFQTLDSLYTVLINNSEKRAEIGDVNHLEVLNIKAKESQISLQLNMLKVDIENAYKRLKVLMNYDKDFTIPSSIQLLPEVSEIPNNLPVYDLFKNETEYASSLIKIEKNKMLPDISINYFLGSNQYENAKYYHGFQVGIALPLFYNNYTNKIKAAELYANAENLLVENQISITNNRLNQFLSDHIKYKTILDNYYLIGKPLINEIMRTALNSFQLGEINFYQFVSSYETAIQMQLEYFDNVLNFNRTILEIIYFSK
ncbi:MAG TPA: CusA/CzcA family heavy metal efflux RND transporter [Bacteroidales bacterium]|nr:CusA/CzcA family heavy metal efflux RND transporter [Bacteroidales bacterium]HOL98830.1 CusA/CzcA family heavy metal efflux RND transporter [Bacteroidales bacterium]HOM37336.1 CusA/CzcA family heavy metal efflux RND transporter [Bacteroidales bacterium]HPD24876.1 CusA/CzcA family heavy metal efflux RND transporter [Bacteroidales bacterium]HRT81094.1 CusA/CzcA family heavy metal efflux RND transporter [Bacteroidales bacterium]